MEQTKSAYEQKYQAQLDQMQARIDQLSAKVKHADAEAKLQLESSLTKIKARKEILENRLNGLRAAGDNAWQELKQGVADAADDVSRAFANARSHF